MKHSTKSRSLLALFMAIAMVLSIANVAWAADDHQSAGAMTDGKSTTTIPVTIDAEATIFDADIPTQFPSTMDPETGETTNGVPEIENNSYGSIVVTKIVVKDNSSEGTPATWHLAAFDKDMSQVPVNSNLIGIAVYPSRDETGEEKGTGLFTTDENPAEQTLLDGYNEEWIIRGKTATDGSNYLRVVYDTNISAVSETISNFTAASIILTIAWDTGGSN